MKTVKCNYCQSEKYQLLNSGKDLLLNKDGHFQLVECLNCSLIYQNPQLSLSDLSKYYPSSYLPHTKPNKSKSSILQRVSHNHGETRRINQLNKYLPSPGRLLDIGCATGDFLHHMKNSSWDVIGVETSAHAADFARQQFNLQVITGTLEDTDFPNNHFDVITMWDVLEHVNDPKSTLSRIAKILKPNGLLVLSLPNPNSLEAKLFKNTWVGWDRPRHLHIFSPEMIDRYLTEAGFELQKIESLGGRLGLTLLSVEFFLKKHNVPENIIKPISKILYNPLLRILTWPFYKILELTNQTTNMNVFAHLSK